MTLIPKLALDDIAIFSDFDGTLVAIAEQPSGVVVDAELQTLLAQLQQRTLGRVALVTGRSVNDLQQLLKNSQLTIAGSHGAEWCLSGAPAEQIADSEALVEPLKAQIKAFAQQRNLLVEDKRFALAVHFRQAPELQQGPFVKGGAVDGVGGDVGNGVYQLDFLRREGFSPGDPQDTDGVFSRNERHTGNRVQVTDHTCAGQARVLANIR